MSDGWSYHLKYESRTVEVPSGRSVIGRSRTCDVSISGPSISRRHVDLIANAGKLIVQDLGSSNGTFINGERIRGQGELNDGDKLRLGDVRLGVEIRRTIPSWTPKSEPQESSGPARGRDIASLAPPMGALPKSTMPPSDATVHLRDVDPDELDTAVGVELDSSQKSAVQAAIQAADEASKSSVDSSPNVSSANASSASSEEFPETPPPEERSLASASELPTVKADAVDFGEINPTRSHFLAASFERRLVAGLLDALWSIGLGVGIWKAVNPNLGGATFVAVGLVLTAGWAIWGTTPGKQLLGLYVCDADGEVGIGWKAAFLRLFGYLLTILTLGIGFFLVLRPSRAALHDTFSKTQVRHRISL